MRKFALSLAILVLSVPVMADSITSTTCTATGNTTVTQTSPSSCQVTLSPPFNDVATASISSAPTAAPGSSFGNSFQISVNTAGNFGSTRATVQGTSSTTLSTGGAVRSGYLAFTEGMGLTGISATFDSNLSVGSLSQACTQFVPGAPECTGSFGIPNGNGTGVVPFTLGESFNFVQAVFADAAKGPGSIPHFEIGAASFSFTLFEADRVTPVQIFVTPEPGSFLLLGFGVALLFVIKCKTLSHKS